MAIAFGYQPASRRSATGDTLMNADMKMEGNRSKDLDQKGKRGATQKQHSEQLILQIIAWSLKIKQFLICNELYLSWVAIKISEVIFSTSIHRKY